MTETNESVPTLPQRQMLVPIESPSISPHNQAYNVDSEYVRNKKIRNVEGHKEAVFKKLESEEVRLDPPTITQVNESESWQKGAEKIDPIYDDGLAKMWQGALHDIMRRRPDNEEMIAILGQMSKEDANNILRISPKAVTIRPNLSYEKLIKLGVMKPYGLTALNGFRFQLRIFIFLTLTVIALWGLNNFGRISQNEMDSSIAFSKLDYADSITILDSNLNDLLKNDGVESSLKKKWNLNE